MLAVVDVRGLWPILIRGVVGVVLEGADRGITLTEAIRLAAAQGSK